MMAHELLRQAALSGNALTEEFRSGGTVTTAIIGTVAGTTPMSQLASAPVVSPSAHDSAAAWRLPRLNGTTAARSRAGSAAATNGGPKKK
jgi:hypothetical protein